MKTVELRNSLDELYKLQRVRKDISDELSRAVELKDSNSTVLPGFSSGGFATGSNVYTMRVGLSDETVNHITADYVSFLADKLTMLDVAINNLEVM